VNSTAFVIVCQFDKLDEDGLIYSVEWQKNDDLLASEELEMGVYEHQLDEYNITEKLKYRDQVCFLLCIFLSDPIFPK
jgi:hypothetical protein